MYPEYFGLSEPSFSITPDPHYLFLSQRHREALAHLLYGTGESGGFVQLTGEVGTGKTTICRAFLEQVPDKIDIALILNPALSETELLQSICEEFGISLDPDRHSTKALVDQLNHYLLEAHSDGRRAVLIIDEAQNLNRDVLEQIRLLTNLETAKHKLLQIFLIGQPELRDMLQRDDLRQLAQRITARYHLTPLDRQETSDYIRHRLAVAGVKRKLFTEAAIKRIYQLSGGVPRLINILCDRALLGAYAGQKNLADHKIVRKAATELQMLKTSSANPGWRRPTTIALALLLITAGVTGFGLRMFDTSTAPEPDVTAKILPPVQSAEHTDTATKSEQIIINKTEPRLPSVDFDSITLDLSQAQANLLALWRAEAQLQPGIEFCAKVVSLGLRCRKSRGTWSSLRQLNRPALVQLRHDAGPKKYLLVTGIDANKIQLLTETGVQNITTSALDPYWYGDFIILWQPPNNRTSIIGPKSRGQIVLDLRSLISGTGTPLSAAENPGLYDQNLQNAVRDFQASRGLIADGIVGPETYIYLTSPFVSEDAPRLGSVR